MSSLGHLRAVTILGLAILVTLALGSCASPTPTAAPGSPASHQEMARHYAPIIRQGVASDQDFITAVDFDGDWVGNNNWENQPTGDLSAYVYYSVIETEDSLVSPLRPFSPSRLHPRSVRKVGGLPRERYGVHPGGRRQR